jgi:DNA-binding transcriptional LysR family regulator
MQSNAEYAYHHAVYAWMSMPLNLKALLALRAVIAEGTVTAAAQRLHRTQPAVSRLIAQLESSVGFALFAREGRRLLPTPEGLAFYRQTERAFAALSEIDLTARDIREQRSAPLRVIAQSHIVHGLLQFALEGFCQRHPEARLSIEIRQREYISHWIANQQFDLGFAPAPVDHPRIETEPLVLAPLLVALPRSHRLAARSALSIADLAREPMVATRPGSPIRNRLDAVFAANGTAALIRVETASSLSACQLVGKGVGLAFTDPFVAGLFAADLSIAFRPLAGAMEVEYLVLRPRGRGASPLAEEFVAAVKAAARLRIGAATSRRIGRAAPRGAPGSARARRPSRR